MVNTLSKLAYWQIITLGVITTVAASFAVVALFTALIAGLPAWTTLLAVLQIVASFGTAWYVSGIFVKAWTYKKQRTEVQAALDRILKAFTEAFDATKKD
jgi:uncharacterized membrane protein YccC